METNISEIKKQLIETCSNDVNSRLATVNNIITSNKKALLSETKSSAGDKHETGRAMLQLEMEKASQQLSEIEKMQQVLCKISLDKKSDVVSLGSLIKTTKGTYFLAISLGKVSIQNTAYFVVSTQSPIGKQLLGKKVGSIIPFNQAEILEIY